MVLSALAKHINARTSREQIKNCCIRISLSISLEKKGFRYECRLSPPDTLFTHLRRNRSNRAAPRNFRRSLLDSTNQPVRHVLHLWSPLTAKWTQVQFSYAIRKHPTITSVSKLKVHVAAAVAKIPADVLLASTTQVVTDVLKFIALPGTRLA